MKGHGYGVTKDGFGYEGVRTTLKAGGKLRIEVERRNIAKRLGRLTGAGLFAEGEKLGIPPLLPESGVSGCDSVLTAKHDGKLFWLWGDTNLPGYPLGIFNCLRRDHAACSAGEIRTAAGDALHLLPR